MFRACVEKLGEMTRRKLIEGPCATSGSFRTGSRGTSSPHPPLSAACVSVSERRGSGVRRGAERGQPSSYPGDLSVSRRFSMGTLEGGERACGCFRG